MTDPIADDAEHRRYQRTDIAERGKQGEQQHRSRLDQHVPAENERFHLERPRGEQIGGPLKTVIPDMEWCECGRRRRLAQDALSRFIAVHPALFLVFSFSVDSKLCPAFQAADIALPVCVNSSRLTSAAGIAGLNR